MQQLAFILAQLVVVAATSNGADAGFPTAATSCWNPPVIAPIADPFRPPACPYCAGNRGIEYHTQPGDVVNAVAAGVVSFAGPVAGVGYVVVDHGDGIRATYGGLIQVGLAVGDQVLAGTGVGLAGESVHFGLRKGDEYIDPTPFLGHPRWRARLVPTDGSPPRPAGPPLVSCGIPSSVGVDRR